MSEYQAVFSPNSFFKVSKNKTPAAVNKPMDNQIAAKARFGIKKEVIGVCFQCK